MARPGAVLEVDRRHPFDPGQLLRKRPPAPHLRPLSHRPHRRHETLLERRLRPALAPAKRRPKPLQVVGANQRNARGSRRDRARSARLCPRRGHRRRKLMNDAMTLSQRADALEEKMSRELDYIVIKSRLYSMAEGDMGPAPNAGALMQANPNARVLMGDDPRLPEMP